MRHNAERRSAVYCARPGGNTRRGADACSCRAALEKAIALAPTTTDVQCKVGEIEPVEEAPGARAILEMCDHTSPGPFLVAGRHGRRLYQTADHSRTQTGSRATRVRGVGPGSDDLDERITAWLPAPWVPRHRVAFPCES